MSEQQNTPTPPNWDCKDWRVCGWRDGHIRVICDTANNKATRTPEAAANAKLLTLSSNAIQNAAHRLGMDPLKLAKQLEDGGIAEIVDSLERIGIGEEFDDLEPSDGGHRNSARRLARDLAVWIRGEEERKPA